MEPAQPEAYRAADSLAILRQQWWLVALVTALGLVAAGGWLHSRPPTWESATSVLVQPAGQDANVVGGRTQGAVNLDTEAQLVRSTAVATGAAELLGVDRAPDELARQVSVTVPPNTSVLTITFSAGTPAQAQAGARAFAEAYLDHRERTARAELAAQTEAIETMLAGLDERLTRLNERLAGTEPGSGAQANLDSQRGTLTNQVNDLTDRLNALATATVSPGAVISEAQPPDQPARPAPAVVLASGAALGLVAGLAAAGLAERLARRVRRPADLSRRLGVPVLASFPPAIRPPGDEIASPYAPAGRTFDRLRNEVIAWERSRPAGAAAGAGAGTAVGAAAPERAASDAGPVTGTGRGQVIVVASPTGGPGCGPVAGLVAANLAASLSRCGYEVILVEAVGPGTARPLTRLLGVAAAPGLSELLAGRTSVVEALQRPARYPRLRVMTMGGTATATGLLQSPALRTVLAALTTQAGYVVVEAPATATSADAQSLAGHADLALLAIETRRTRLADAADAATQLHRVGTPLLGAVLLPAHRRAAAAQEPAGPDGDPPDWPERGGPDREPPVDRPGPSSNGRPAATRLRGAEPPAPRPPDSRGGAGAPGLAEPAGAASPVGAVDGQTLVLAGLVDEIRAAGAAGQPEPPDPDRPGEPARPGAADRPGEPARPGAADRPGDPDQPEPPERR